MIACFGEIMLRISPQPDYYLIEQSSDFKIIPGGSESNVAIALGCLGNKTTMLTVLPNDIFGSKILRYLKYCGVDTSRVILHNKGRMGLYFTEKGSGIRGYRVFYDRENSSYNYVDKCSLNIDQWLEGCAWLHLSGIALATSRNAADFALLLTEKAIRKGIRVSFDINDRKLLWKWCKSQEEKFKYLIQVVKRSTILLGNESDLNVGLFGQFKMSQEIILRKLNKIVDKDILKWVAVSQREYKSSNINSFGGVVYDFQNTKKPKKYIIKPQIITEIIDRIGTGDAFCGAIIDGYIKKLGPQLTLKRAVILGTLKHSISGDACMFDTDLFEKCLFDNKGIILR